MPKAPTQAHDLVASHHHLAAHPADGEVEELLPAALAADAGFGAEQFGPAWGVMREPAEGAEERGFASHCLVSVGMEDSSICYSGLDGRSMLLRVEEACERQNVGCFSSADLAAWKIVKGTISAADTLF